VIPTKLVAVLSESPNESDSLEHQAASSHANRIRGAYGISLDRKPKQLIVAT
jgi:hypothetical protein